MLPNTHVRCLSLLTNTDACLLPALAQCTDTVSKVYDSNGYMEALGATQSAQVLFIMLYSR